MKTRISLRITLFVQAAYFSILLLIGLLIWLFTLGVPYTYPFAILSSIIIIPFFPVEVCCLIPNLIFLIMDMKASQLKSKGVAICAVIIPFVLICVAKVAICLISNDVLVGIV